MRPKKAPTMGEGDLFRARLDQIINVRRELVQLASKIDWDRIDHEMAPVYSDKGRPGIETRFVIGLLLLKYGLSDEGVCERWVYDPYFQRFTGETFFQHEFPHERAKLLHAAIKGLNRLANKWGVRLRQSYLRIAKRAAMMAGRYAHAKQFKRHHRQLRLLRTRLGRLICDIPQCGQACGTKRLGGLMVGGDLETPDRSTTLSMPMARMPSR
jgi:IS5 family transposase